MCPQNKDEKDGKAGGAGTAATPKQRQPTVSASLSVSAVPSRPSSPASSVAADDPAVLSGTSVLQAALQKKQGRNSKKISTNVLSIEVFFNSKLFAHTCGDMKDLCKTDQFH